MQARAVEVRMLHSKLDNVPPKYWVVDRDNDREREAPLEHLCPITEQESILRLEAEEEGWLLDKQTTSLDQELKHDENTEWLRGCEWSKWFLHVIVVAAALPSSDTTKDIALGLWQGLEYVSFVKFGRMTWRIFEASKNLFQ
jgi:hypothetical protein